MRRTNNAAGEQLRAAAARQNEHARIWRVIRRKSREEIASADHPLEPREPGLGICRRCGLDRIAHRAA